jgi:hypothetical protein
MSTFGGKADPTTHEPLAFAAPQRASFNFEHEGRDGFSASAASPRLDDVLSPDSAIERKAEALAKTIDGPEIAWKLRADTEQIQV